jgi:hypothetical protein
VLTNTGHDEYWSASEVTNETAARNAGVNLAFFSGNEVYWKTRFAADAAGEAGRTLITYKESLDSAQTDPNDPTTWTGEWADPRFSPPDDGGLPGNALTGQLWTVNEGTYAIQVPAAYSKLRVWRNTGVASLQPDQTVTLAPETLGYEWDVDIDNGFQPAGLIDMSSTTETPPQVVTDYQEALAAVTQTHHLTLYRATSGALVFDAGTVQWAWGLNSDHDGDAENPADPNMQQATVNILADMHAEPTTLMSSLSPANASTDTTPPTSTITSPAAGTSYADGAAVTISGTATDAGGVVAGVEISTDGGTTWHPVTTMSSAAQTVTWSYSWLAHGNPTATIETRATDDSGNIETPGDPVHVTINCPCSTWGNNITPKIPDSGDGNSIEVGVKFTSDVAGYIDGIRFYKSAANTGTHFGNLWTASGQLLATATFTNETASGWQQVNFAQPVAINANTTYIASYFAPNGHYSQSEQYFLNPPLLGGSATNAPPLHAAFSTQANPNGLYIYTKSSSFPTLTYNAENYWVDVAFTSTSTSTPPGQPTNVTATPGYASATVSWTASTSGSPATSYTVTPYIGTTAQTPVTVTGNPAPTSTTVPGLTNGTAYTFTVTPANPSGTGTRSAPSNSVTPSASMAIVANGGFESSLSPWTGAGVVTPTVSTANPHSGTASALLGTLANPEPKGDSSLSQTVTVPANGTSTLTFWYWPQTSDDLCSGTSCKYDWQQAQVRDTSGNTLASIFQSNSNAKTWTSVTYDLTPYAGRTIQLWFNVHQDGGGDPTAMYLDDVSVTNSQSAPPTAPTAPANVSASAGNASATVGWTAPSDDGSPITSYTVTPYIGSAAQTPVTVSGSTTVAAISGLTDGTSYTFTVTATNAVGTGPASTASNAVTPTASTNTSVAFVQQVSAHTGTSASLSVTPSANLTSGNRLVVLVGVWASNHPTASSVTDSAGDTFTEVQHVTASDGTELSVWTAPITAGGGTKPSIKVTPSAKADLGIEALEYSGLSTAAGSAAVDVMSSASGTTSSAATVQSGATPLTNEAGELGLGFYVDSGFGDTLTPGTGFTQRVNVSKSGDIEFLAEDATEGLDATPSAPAGTGSKTTWLMSTVVFKTA